ncbi:hypothetical protein Tco_0902487 [Tanacetum coccineum]
MDDKGKGIMDDKGKGIMDDVHSRVDRLEKGNSKVMAKKASTSNALDLQNRIKKLSDDFNRFVKAKKPKNATEAKFFFCDEDLVLLSDVKYPLTAAEKKMFKEKPTSSTATTSTALIASTSSALVVAPRGYRKIAMTGCVLSFKS